MDTRIKLPESCSSAALRDGSKLLQSKFYFPLPQNILPGGKILLRAKVCDSLNFVDHPKVELDTFDNTVSGFSCDCPDYRANHRFCMHCAALVLELAETTGLMQSATAAQETADDSSDFTEGPPKEELTEDELPCLTDFSYTFCNSPWDLYPRVREPRIPLERYIQAFGNNARARSIYQMAGLWGGSCYGISATASMFQQNNGDTRITDFNENAKIPSELQLNDCHRELDLTLHQFIELVHILQYSGRISYEVNKNLATPDCLNMLAQRVKDFRHGKTTPTVMCVWRSPRMDGGHAIMPFRLETVSDSEDILHIYDPNRPMVTSYAYLQKDEQGNYLNWRFPMSENNVYSSSETGAKLSMTPYEVYKAAWDNRGSSAVDNILSIQPGVAVKDAAGELLVRVTDASVESFRDDIYQIPVMAGASDDRVMISLPVGQYTVCQENAQAKELSLHLAGTNLSVSVATTASEAVIVADDSLALASAEISQSNARYEIGIVNTFGQEAEEIFLNGLTGTEKLHLVQKDSNLYAAGLTAQCALYINDAYQSLDRIGQLVGQEIPAEQEADMVLNAADAAPKADNQD